MNGLALTLAIPLPREGPFAEATWRGYLFLAGMLLGGASAAVVFYVTRKPSHGTRCLGACCGVVASVLFTLLCLAKGLTAKEEHRVVWFVGAVAGVGGAVFAAVDARHHYKLSRQAEGTS